MSKAIKRTIGLTLLGILGYFGYKKVQDFAKTLTVTIAQVKINARNFIREGLRVNVQTNVDLHAGIRPKIRAVVVKLYYFNGKTWSLIGTSIPQLAPIQLERGRNILSSDIQIQSFGLVSSLIGKEIHYRIETTVIPDILPAQTDVTEFRKSISDLKDTAITLLDTTKDLKDKLFNNTPQTADLQGITVADFI